MAQVVLMPNTSSASVGAGTFVTTLTTQVNLQFVPQAGLGFSGTVLIQSSTAPNPASTDWFTIATLVFSAHTTTVDINLYLSDNPWLRANIPTGTPSQPNPSVGSISVYAGY